MQLTRYALFHKDIKSFLGVRASANSCDEFCADVSYKFDIDVDSSLWNVSSYEEAENARVARVKWYNAGYLTPENPYNPQDLKVVELTITCEGVA